MGDKNEEEKVSGFRSQHPASRRQTVKTTISVPADNEIPLLKFVLVET
jgi:hypothetical protein